MAPANTDLEICSRLLDTDICDSADVVATGAIADSVTATGKAGNGKPLA